MADEVPSIADYMRGLQILEHAYRYITQRHKVDWIMLDAYHAIFYRAICDVSDALDAQLRVNR